MKKKVMIISVAGILFSSCFKYVNYKNFTLKDERLNPNALQKNGFYYFTEDETIKGKDNASIPDELYFFYCDGTFGQSGSFGNSVKEFCDKLKKNISFKKDVMTHMDKFRQWGRYQITGNNLLIQAFESYSESKYEVYVHKGIVESNKSFTINAKGFYFPNSKDMPLDSPLKEPKYFKFYRCDDCKPDSMNWLMKRNKI